MRKTIDNVKFLEKDENFDINDENSQKKLKKVINYQYVYFPIGGNFSKKNIISRLKDIKINNNDKIALHLDILDTYEYESIKLFLFSFLILKNYSINENLFIYDDKFLIKIEIPNSFEDNIDKFNNLKLIENKVVNNNLIEINLSE